MPAPIAREPRRIRLIEREQLIGRDRAKVFGFFADAMKLEALTPPWLHFGVLTAAPIEMATGAEIAYRMRLHGLPVRWLTRIEEWQPHSRFVDRQLRGPYRLWHHTHTFEDRAGGTLMRDRVRYAIPLGPVGRAAEALFVRRDLEAIFDFRREAVSRLLG
jgi:ligand-binding SRPBCC domain-containing protein